MIWWHRRPINVAVIWSVILCMPTFYCQVILICSYLSHHVMFSSSNIPTLILYLYWWECVIKRADPNFTFLKTVGPRTAAVS